MRFYAWLDKSLLKQFDRVVAVSDPIMREIQKHGTTPKKIVKILNGIDVDRFVNTGSKEDLKERVGIPKKARVIGTVGRLSEEKGHFYILDVAADIIRQFADVVFLFIGDGPLRMPLENRAKVVTEHLKDSKTVEGEKFFFPGFLSDISGIYAILDIFVLPSLNEGLPMVLLEAMASAKPIIATCLGAVPTVLKHDHSGILIRPGDHRELRESILELLANPQKARKLADNARHRVVQDFSSKTMAERYIEVYQAVLRMHGSSKN
jgi:glycosyltransferase involved in cell wall biosynthesis